MNFSKMNFDQMFFKFNYDDAVRINAKNGDHWILCEDLVDACYMNIEFIDYACKKVFTATRHASQIELEQNEQDFVASLRTVAYALRKLKENIIQYSQICTYFILMKDGFVLANEFIKMIQKVINIVFNVIYIAIEIDNFAISFIRVQNGSISKNKVRLSSCFNDFDDWIDDCKLFRARLKTINLKLKDELYNIFTVANPVANTTEVA